MPDPVYEITILPTGGRAPVRLDGRFPRLDELIVDPTTRQLRPVDMTAQILSMAYEDDEKKADKLTLTINNWTLEAFDSPLWENGAVITASWGYPGRMSVGRECIVQKVKGWQILTIEALSQAAILNKKAKTRSFTSKTLSQIVATIAEEYGFGESARFIDAYNEVIDFLPQSRMTDAALLADQARRVGAEFYIDFDGFHFHERKLGQRPIKVYEYYIGERRGEITKIDIEGDVYTKKAGGTTLKGIDPITKQPIEATADNASVPKPALAATTSIFTGVDARDGTSTDTQTSVTGSSTVAPTTQATTTAAKTQATASFAKNQLSGIKLNVDAIGDPLVLAKTVVELRGVGKALSGNYYITTVNHKLGAPGGYTMSMKWRRGGKNAEGGVKTSGPVNESKAAGGGADPAKVSIDPSTGLDVVDRRDGTSSFVDTGGRSQTETPAPPANPLAFFQGG